MKERCFDCARDALTIAQVAAIIVVPVCLLLFHVWNQFRMTDLGYQIAEVTREHRGLLEENKKLSIEAAVQGRTDRMAQLARDQFGLAATRPDQVITVRLDEGGEDKRLAASEHAPRL